MSEMVERAVAAMRTVNEQSQGLRYSELIRAMARAVIEEMREPTKDQSNAGYQFLLADSEKHGYGDRTDDQKLERMRGYYRAMVDEALK